MANGTPSKAVEKCGPIEDKNEAERFMDPECELDEYVFCKLNIPNFHESLPIKSVPYIFTFYVRLCECALVFSQEYLH